MFDLRPETPHITPGRAMHELANGIFLLTDYDIDEHYILIPSRPDYRLDMDALDLELYTQHGLEIMDEDEMPSVLIDSGIKVWCAEVPWR